MLSFFHRPYPSANAILLHGSRPVLVDPGSAPEIGDLRDWLADQGASPGLVVNTHWHSDHSGANRALGLPVAASAIEAAAAKGADFGRTQYLGQEMEPYAIDRSLQPGDDVEGWDVVALPGHTPGQIGLFHAGSATLIAGDALHGADVGWLDIDADPQALERTEATIEAIAALGAGVVLSGHGPAVQDVPAALARARRRVAGWRAEPERIAWHACKRILAHALMVEGGIPRDEIAPRLTAMPWFRDHATRAFGLSPDAFVAPLLAEMLRADAAHWQANNLVPTTPHTRVPRASRWGRGAAPLA